MSGRSSQPSPCRAKPLCSLVSAALIYRAPLMTAGLHGEASRLGTTHCEDSFIPHKSEKTSSIMAELKTFNLNLHLQ